MAGTDGMREALEWGRQAFADAALSDVRLEAVPMPLLWEEGATRLEVVEPAGFPLRAVSSALSPAVLPAMEADLADGGKGRPGFIARSADRYRGKAVLVRLDEAGSFDELAVEQRDAMIALREASDAGALAVLFISTRPNRLMYRHVNNVAGRLDGIPSALVAREDGLRLARMLQGGARVRVSLRMPNRIGAAYETANVVADIPGEDSPGEIVLLGAHLDSWDMGTGCLDNAALVVHVARAIRSAGLRPRRTLRFVLFGGEELGLFGSRAYADRHRPELDQHVASLVHDMGNGPLAGYSVGGRDELVPALDRILSPLPGRDRLKLTEEAYFLSDNLTFALEGVPSLFAVQDTSGFFLTYHSEADTFDKVRVGEAVEAAAAAAATVLGIANASERFGRRLAAQEVLAWIQRIGLSRHLRFLGVWDAWRPPGVDPGLGAGGDVRD